MDEEGDHGATVVVHGLICVAGFDLSHQIENPITLTITVKF